ncbi:hypothetical protein [Nocardia sp. NBC_01327]|uniref:hypothetical protein n=1 Tax=Nocardia sp. NBC_01327 TaxID=2903593 RepID=UPI002E124816|nr:hypothetical protein OG326_27525 [Nocardia sp. NBC_01327]
MSAHGAHRDQVAESARGLERLGGTGNRFQEQPVYMTTGFGAGASEFVTVIGGLIST